MFAQRPTWSVNETIFENTQTMIAKLSLDGKLLENPNDMVGAFVGNECRGVASPVFIPATGKYYTYLTVFSNKQGEEINFKLYEHGSGRIVPVDKKLNFNINDHLGSFFQAYSIAMPTLSNQAAISRFELYNVKPDSVVTRGDVRVFYVPVFNSKDTITTNFSISMGAKVYVKEVPVVPKVTKINFTKQVIFQVVSQDESNLLNYKVEVVNSPTPDCSTISIAKPSISNVSYCINASAGVLSATALSGKQLVWYGNNATGGTGALSAPTPLTDSARVLNYYVVQRDTLSGCESERAKITVTVSAIPVKPLVSNLSYCQSSEKPTLSAEALPNARLVWYGTNEVGGIGSDMHPTVLYNASAIVNYYVSQKDTLSGCESPRSKIVVTSLASQIPPKPIVADVNYCVSESVKALSASALSGNKLVWYGNLETLGVGVFTSPLPVTSAVGIANYFVAQKDTITGCESPRAKIKVTVTSTVPKPIVSNVSYCVDAATSPLLAKTVDAYKLVWYGTNERSGQGGSQAPIPNSSIAGTLTYYVSQEDSLTGCESDRSKITVTILANPVKPTVANLSYCQNSNNTSLSAASSKGSKLIWYGKSETAGTSSEFAPVVEYTLGAVATYFVSQRDTLTGCESPRAKIVVTSLSAKVPNKPIVADVVYCQNANATALRVTNIPGTRILWYGLNATGGIASTASPVPSTELIGNLTYYVAQQDTSSGCPSDRATIKVSTLANPSKPSVMNVSYCQNAPTTALTATALAGNKILWFGTNESGGTSTSTNPIPSSTTVGELAYYVVQRDTSSGCASDRAAIKVSILAPPAKPTVSLDASYNLVSSAPAGNQWYKEGVLINAAVSSVYKPASNGTYTVKVTTSGCPSEMSANFNYLITAITNLAKEEFVTLSPNPVVDELRIQYYLINSSKAYVSILDMSGRPVVDGKEMATDSTVSLRELPSGLYVLRLLDSDGRLLYTQKIVKI